MQKTDMENPLATGREIIKNYAKDLPHSPGVYRMIDEENNILYVGKAKSLKNRVTNYVNTGSLNNRLQKMISLTAKMEFITTRSEAEALLLEANLIKKHSPRYNILLKDDKSFPYIFFSGDHDFPRIGKHRGAKTGKGKYFGPFVSAGAVDETVTLLEKTFLIRSCSDNIFKNRTRPCLQYQIKRCCAPCTNYISKEDYAALCKQTYDFLGGKNSELQKELADEMELASKQQNYEKAATLRDRIRHLTQIQNQNKLSSSSITDADIIAIVNSHGSRVTGHENKLPMTHDSEPMTTQSAPCIQIFSFRGSRNYGSKSFFPKNTEGASAGEILANFIAGFYQNQPTPKLILTNEPPEEKELLEEALNLNSSYKIEIATPSRGEKLELMQQALQNAREALMRKLTQSISQKSSLENVQKLFDLPELPNRIEVYDNSHISGTDQVGAMIVAGQDGFIKNAYRKFDIKNEATQGDDYAMLREVLTRRFKRLKEEPNNRPDLVLIDGGAGQFSVAGQVFTELGINDIIYASIAKGVDRNAGREWFFITDREPFQLPVNDPTLHYLQILRDEAHRFAIGAHRNKRSKTMQTSELDAITGIGAKRKKALLTRFGSAREVAAASLDEIAGVEGIGSDIAEKIYRHFHG